MKNFWFLFSAYLLIWTGICFYLVRLSAVQRRILARLGEIRRLLNRGPGS